MAQYPIVPREGGSQSKLDITAATVVKASPGTLYRVSVITAATAGTMGAYDAATTGGASASSAIFSASSNWPAAGTVIELQWPCQAGIVVNPGTGGVVSVSFA